MSDWLVPSRPDQSKSSEQSGSSSTAQLNAVQHSVQQYQARIESLSADNDKLKAQLQLAVQAEVKKSALANKVPPINIDQDAAALLAMSIAAGSFLFFILAS